MEWLLFTSPVLLVIEQFEPKWIKYQIQKFSTVVKNQREKKTVGVTVWPTEPRSRRRGQGGIDELERNGNREKSQPARWDFVFMVLGKLCFFPRHDTILIALSGMRTIPAARPLSMISTRSYKIISFTDCKIQQSKTSFLPPMMDELFVKTRLQSKPHSCHLLRS